MIAAQVSRALVRVALIVLVSLSLATVGLADEVGESAPKSVPEAAAPTPPTPETLDDKVGRALNRSGYWLGKIGAATHDILILRTMGTAATIAGLGFFVVSSPIWGPTGELRESWDTFVAAPGEYTFERPLGQF